MMKSGTCCSCCGAAAFWIAGYLLLIAGLATGLHFARHSVIDQYDTPEAAADWEKWRNEHAAKSGRTAKTTESPSVVLLRDQYPLVLGGAILLSTVLYGFLAFIINGVLKQRRVGSAHLNQLSIFFLALSCSLATATARGEGAAAKRDAAANAESQKLPLDGVDGRDLALDKFRPRTMLRVPQTVVRRAKFPVVDVHVHMRIKARHSVETLTDYVKAMDEQNVAVGVSLDGQLGGALDEHLAYLKPAERRFVVFANIDWRGTGKPDEPATWDCHRDDFARRMTLELADAKKRGAAGLKIFKDFGLTIRNPGGSLVAIDDRRWDPIWKACGELGLPVLIHTADPAAFFEPIDARNERWEELRRHPDWSFYGERFPKRDELFAAFNRVVERHPKTTFIAAHLANNPEDLATLGTWLDKYPNLHVEIAARLAEIGRQPRTARAFFIKYADRIMFGTDGPRSRARLLPHWRVLETRDEYFAYAEPDQYPPQGLWNVYGLDLPDDVLRKVYYENAARLIPGVKDRLADYERR